MYGFDEYSAEKLSVEERRKVRTKYLSQIERRNKETSGTSSLNPVELI
jgi:hypothetical protein